KLSANEIAFEGSLPQDVTAQVDSFDGANIQLNPSLFPKIDDLGGINKLAVTLTQEWVHTEQFKNISSSIFFGILSLFPPNSASNLPEKMAYRLAGQVADALKKVDRKSVV